MHAVRRSVVPRRWLEDDSLDFAERCATEPEGGLEPLLTELAGVQGAPELVEDWAFVVLDPVARGLEQDHVARAPLGVREPDEPIAAFGAQIRERDDHAVAGLKALSDRRLEQFPRTRVEFLLGYASGDQAPDLFR